MCTKQLVISIISMQANVHNYTFLSCQRFQVLGSSTVTRVQPYCSGEEYPSEEGDALNCTSLVLCKTRRKICSDKAQTGQNKNPSAYTEDLWTTRKNQLHLLLPER